MTHRNHLEGDEFYHYEMFFSAGGGLTYLCSSALDKVGRLCNFVAIAGSVCLSTVSTWALLHPWLASKQCCQLLFLGQFFMFVRYFWGPWLGSNSNPAYGVGPAQTPHKDGLSLSTILWALIFACIFFREAFDLSGKDAGPTATTASPSP